MVSADSNNDYPAGSPPQQDDFPPGMAGGAAQGNLEPAMMVGPLYQTEVRMGARSGTEEKPQSNS